MATRLEISLLKRLDDLEKEFLNRFRRYLQQIIHLPHAYNDQQVSQLQFPAPGVLGNMLTDHMRDMFATGQAHGDVLIRELHRKYGKHQLADWQPSCHRLAIGYDPETFWLTPTAALQEFAKREVMLAGDVEGDIWRQTKSILLDHLHGTPRADTEKAIAALVDKNMSRAQLITTTETTYAYNRGRLTSFHGNDVDYVQFSAVMDARTSPQCRSRHGKVMRMDSPNLANNMPPLHGRCRSVLLPVFSRYQPEMITPESSDWSNVTALPKGWQVDPNMQDNFDKRGPKNDKKPERLPVLNNRKVFEGRKMDVSRAEQEIEKLLRGAPLHDRRKLAKHLLKESNIDCPVHIVQMKARGSFRWVGKDGELVKPHELNLQSNDKRPYQYQIKTIFHEVTHARMSGSILNNCKNGGGMWLSVEETVAETVAHYMVRKAGVTGEIGPAYSAYLVENLPRLKQLPEFAECKTIADFGKALSKYRYDMRVADWGGVIKKIEEQTIDMVKYIKQYEHYVRTNIDDIVQVLEDTVGINSFTEANREYVKKMILDAWNEKRMNQALMDSLIIAMNRMGVN